MSIWVLTADAARARIFEAHSAKAELRELEDLVHPSSRLSGRDLVSDSPGAGRARAAGAGAGHTMGHERDAVAEEHERFAREVTGRLRAAREQGRFARLHVLAAPRFLGALRAHMDDATRKLVASEHDVDVTGETPEQIRARLPKRL